MSWWQSYGNYLSSAEWTLFKEAYYMRYPKACAVCGDSKVQLHHMSYDNFRSKNMADYKPLCVKHHQDLTTKYRAQRRGGLDLRTFTLTYITKERNAIRSRRRR